MRKTIRKAYNAGLYYPNSKEEIEKFLTLFNYSLEQAEDAKERLSITPQAIIVPHGNYYFSGFTANIAHRLLAKNNPKRVVIIAAAENKDFSGIAACDLDSYETPLGELQVDRDYLNIIAAHFPISLIESDYRKEYKTEIQMPFIAHYQPNVEVIELLYNECEKNLLIELLYWLLEDTLTSVIISSNLSQNVTEELGNTLDTFAINAIANQNTSMLHEAEASSIEGIEALLTSASRLKLSSHLLDYRTSTDVTTNQEDCTGYISAAFCKDV